MNTLLPGRKIASVAQTQSVHAIMIFVRLPIAHVVNIPARNIYFFRVYATAMQRLTRGCVVFYQRPATDRRKMFESLFFAEI